MVSIQLQDSVAAALSAQAAALGLSLEQYLSQLADSGTALNGPRLTADEFLQQLDVLALDVPPLPADFSRADIYLDHD